MTTLKRWTPGDPLTAERLNEGISESVRPRRDISLGNGSSLVNETLGNQSATNRFQPMKLVVAVTDFVVSETPTDIAAWADDIPSGLVKEVRLNRRSGTHGKDDAEKSFLAYDPVGGLVNAFCDLGSASASASASNSTSNSGSLSASVVTSSSKSECDVFYVFFNQDSKRWEVVSSGAEGSVRDIRFEIADANPDNLTALVTILSWDSGFTIRDVPGQFGLPGLELNVVEVCDPSGCYLNEPAEELFARQGRARYTQGTAEGVCRQGSAPFDPVWEVYALCCQNPSCDVIF